MRQYGEVVAVPVCATPNVHTLRVGRVGRIGAGVPASAPAELKSEADAEAEAEERKAARRLLVANNKAWDAADDVRREFVATLLQRKNAPKDAARFLAIALTRHANTRYASGMVSARGLLGIESSGWDGDTLSQWVEQHPAKGLHMSLAVVSAGFENTANREWWRTPDADSRGYLGQLAAWGYPLSPVEKIAEGIQPEPTDQDDDADTATE
ncbi:MAG: chromosome partitioning protein [Mycobacterium sp.]|nr:chromosome partitioning protein [Mycobacterium sp.]